jgi:hypothetical protein
MSIGSRHSLSFSPSQALPFCPREQTLPIVIVMPAMGFSDIRIEGQSLPLFPD